jgi:hypothetical protein
VGDIIRWGPGGGRLVRQTATGLGTRDGLGTDWEASGELSRSCCRLAEVQSCSTVFQVKLERMLADGAAAS